MKAASTAKTSERAGRWLGRVWRGVARRETQVIHWLAAQGLPARMGRLLFWVIKLALFGVLLYAAFWVALLVVFALIAAWLVRNVDLDKEKQAELRDGHSGVGLYAKDDWRIDMGDPDDP